MSTYFASCRKEWLESWRTRRLLVIGVVLLLFGIGSPLLARFTPEMMKMIPGAEAVSGLIPTPTLMDAVSQFVKNTTQFGVLLALLIGMGAVAPERERGTAGIMLSKPLPRGAYLLAKFDSRAVAFLVTLLLAALGAYYYTAVLFEAPDWRAWLMMAILIWIYILVFLAIAVLGSVLFRAQAAAVGLGFGALLFFALLGAVFPGLAPYLPDALVGWSAAQFLDPDFSRWGALVVSLAIVIACLVAAWAVFRRQEL